MISIVTFGAIMFATFWALATMIRRKNIARAANTMGMRAVRVADLAIWNNLVKMFIASVIACTRIKAEKVKKNMTCFWW
jgi:hypothetical protein